MVRRVSIFDFKSIDARFDRIEPRFDVATSHVAEGFQSIVGVLGAESISQ